MGAGLRRASIALHVVSSIGWIGAAAGYLTLAIAASVSDEPSTIRAAWIGMEISGWYGIVPLGVLAFLTGLVMSLGTAWGLIRHYWVLIAFVLTAVSLTVLIVHMPTVSTMAAIARTADDSTVAQLGGDVLHPALGLAVLSVVAVLNLYKPRGLTTYGQHRQHEQASTRNRDRTTRPSS